MRNLEDFIEEYAITIVNGLEEDENNEPTPARELSIYNNACYKMTMCTFDTDEEKWDKARELSEDIALKYYFNLFI